MDSAVVASERAARVRALTSWHHDWSGLRVAVLGLGVTGFSVADTLTELGAKVRVIYSREDPDREQLVDVIGAERALLASDEAQLEDLRGFDPDLVVVSPGYRPDHPLTEWALKQQVPVWGDIELGWRLRDKTDRVAEWICVTGTNGKTTTAELTAHMLLEHGLRAAPVGNIGVPILDALRDPVGYDVLVVELSSFQLHRLGHISPLASVCLNVADDHLDWHGSRESYLAAKGRVYENTRLACVYNRADAVTEHLVEQADVIEGARAISFGLDSPPPSGFGVVEGILVDRGFHDSRKLEAYELTTRDELRERNLDAPHLVQNILAAAALARAAGATPAAIARAVLGFRPDPHRFEPLEPVAAHPRVHWVDDSKATNAHAASASLRAHASVVWIAGGQLKGVDLGSLIADHAARMRAVIVIGSEQAALLSQLAQHAPTIPVIAITPGQTERVMIEAVEAAAKVAQAGDTVLLAPAAASYDQFRDYADRGDRFQAAVRALDGGGAGDNNPRASNEPQ